MPCADLKGEGCAAVAALFSGARLEWRTVFLVPVQMEAVHRWPAPRWIAPWPMSTMP